MYPPQLGKELSSTHAMSMLRREIDSAKWTEQSQDFMKNYIGSKITSKRMSVHRPAIGVTKYQVTAVFRQDPNSQYTVPHWTAKMELEPGFKKVIKDLPDWQREHRSRKISLAFAKGQAIELQRRANSVAKMRPVLKDLTLNDETSLEVAIIQAEAFLKHSKMDPKYINHYIKEHEHSSVMSGIKWPQLGDADKHSSDWQAILQMHRSRAEQVVNGEMMGKMPDFRLSLGSRQRYNGDPSEQYPDEWIHAGAIERSRVVLFHPALSSWFAFLPKEKKPQYYRDTVMGALDVMGVEVVGEYISPLWDGGSIYAKVADALQGGRPLTIGLGDDYNVIDEDGRLYAVDGSTWDSFAGVINGRGSTWMTTYFGGHTSVPSGVMKTSTDDQIAMASVIDTITSREGKMIPDLRDGKLIDGVVEFQPEDEDNVFVLGLTYNLDGGPDNPGICGVKLMEDSAETFRPLQEGRTLNLKREDDVNALLSHQNAFSGLTLDNESLLSVMSKVEAPDWISPGLLLRRTIEFEDFKTRTEV